MSFVIAVPETIAAAATDLADLGSTIAGANAAAAANTTSLLAAGADEISAGNRTPLVTGPEPRRRYPSPGPNRDDVCSAMRAWLTVM